MHSPIVRKTSTKGIISDMRAMCSSAATVMPLGIRFLEKNDGLYQIDLVDSAEMDRSGIISKAFHGVSRQCADHLHRDRAWIKKNHDISDGGHMMNVMPTIMHLYGTCAATEF